MLISKMKYRGMVMGASVHLSFLALLAIQQPIVAQSLRVAETDEQLTVLDGESVVLVYNKTSPSAPRGIDAIYERSGFLHPVCTPSGKVVTAMFPFDHAHQQGIFSAWVKTKHRGKEIDFWNLAKGTGRVLHRRVISHFEEKVRAGFEVEMIHRAEGNPAVDILSERWRVTVNATDGSYRCFDLESVQSAITNDPLIIEQFHYGGMALRGPVHWLTSKDHSLSQKPDFRIEASGFFNDLGSDRVTGNHQNAKWVSLWGLLDGKPTSISVLCDSGNFRAPQAARLHPSKPYFCFAPCKDGEFVIDRTHPLTSRYRYLVTDSRPNSQWLREQWETWVSE